MRLALLKGYTSGYLGLVLTDQGLISESLLARSFSELHQSSPKHDTLPRE
jgi:hypothetical protein